jgi:hypothetical protein
MVLNNRVELLDQIAQLYIDLEHKACFKIVVASFIYFQLG